MSDIVERLRVPIPWCEDYNKERNEAANEIERLQKLLAIEGLSCKVVADIERLHADNERLRALVKTLADDLADEVEGHYQGVKDHPAMLSRYERDMANVYEARRILGCDPGRKTE